MYIKTAILGLSFRKRLFLIQLSFFLDKNNIYEAV